MFLCVLFLFVGFLFLLHLHLFLLRLRRRRLLQIRFDSSAESYCVTLRLSRASTIFFFFFGRRDHEVENKLVNRITRHRFVPANDRLTLGIAYELTQCG